MPNLFRIRRKTIEFQHEENNFYFKADRQDIAQHYTICSMILNDPLPHLFSQHQIQKRTQFS